MIVVVWVIPVIWLDAVVVCVDMTVIWAVVVLGFSTMTVRVSVWIKGLARTVE